jgi:hypothetical protein
MEGRAGSAGVIAASGLCFGANERAAMPPSLCEMHALFDNIPQPDAAMLRRLELAGSHTFLRSSAVTFGPVRRRDCATNETSKREQQTAMVDAHYHGQTGIRSKRLIQWSSVPKSHKSAIWNQY